MAGFPVRRITAPGRIQKTTSKFASKWIPDIQLNANAVALEYKVPPIHLMLLYGCRKMAAMLIEMSIFLVRSH